MAVAPAELAFVADEISRRTGYLDVEFVGPGRGGAYQCAQLLAAARAGGDPTANWRLRVGDNQARYYGVPARPQVGAAFVLQWYLGVVAIPLAWAAVLGPWVLDGAPEAVSFDLSHPDLYPTAVCLRGEGVELIADEEERLRRAHDRYLLHAQAFADAYRPPEVRVGSGQRGGHVHDAWTMALEDARAALSPPGSGPQGRSRRRGCCMIYALPGAAECAACPRGARRMPTGSRPRPSWPGPVTPT